MTDNAISHDKITRFLSLKFLSQDMHYVKLEILKVKTSLNHFALKSKIYVKVLKAAIGELMAIRLSVGV